MRVVVLGKQGQLARSLQRCWPDACYLGTMDLDLAAPAQIQPRLRALAPDVIVNAAAYTAVDQAEDDAEAAFAINAQAVAALAGAAQSLHVPLLHVSTDYVFDGRCEGRGYREDDATGPLGVYGQSKLAGEQALAEAELGDWWVLRTSWVFSEFGQNFVKTMLRLGGERSELSVVDDQRGKPTYAGNIARTIVAVVDRWRTGKPIEAGIYHCACAGEVSWYEFARAIFDTAVERGLLEQAPALHPIGTDGFPTRAERPRNSVLDTSKLEAALERPLPHWQNGLEQVLEAL